MGKTNSKSMAEIKIEILDYLTEMLEVNQNQLIQYEADSLLPPTVPEEVKRMREIEAIKLRDRVTQLSAHISAIKRIFPTEANEPEKRNREASQHSKSKTISGHKARTKGAN